MSKMVEAFRARFAGLREDERGMEAAQVILILVVVVIGLIPVIAAIRNALSSKGASSTTTITNTK